MPCGAIIYTIEGIRKFIFFGIFSGPYSKNSKKSVEDVVDVCGGCYFCGFSVGFFVDF